MNISRRKTKKVALESQLLLENYSFGTSDSFKNNIVLEMTNDEITQTAIGDFLIMKFGESIYSKLKKQHNANYIRQRMRQTARLLIIAKSIDDELEDLEDLLQPKNYDTIIKSVKILGDYNESSGEYGISALPLKIGHNLRKCASVLQTLGIMTSNTNTIQKSRHFLDLMNSEYIVVASQALTSLNHKKFNKPKYLPVTEDVKKLTVYVQRQMSTYSEALKNKGDSDSYIKLAQATLVALLLFNRRRTGEIQRITLEDFHKGINAKTSIDVSDDLSAIEKLMLNQLQRIEIIGKKGRGVPVLLRSSHVAALNLLLQHRNAVGIPESNNFVFARVSPTAKTPMDACKEIRELSSEAGLKAPETIRSTLLQKHIATVSQLVTVGY